MQHISDAIKYLKYLADYTVAWFIKKERKENWINNNESTLPYKKKMSFFIFYFKPSQYFFNRIFSVIYICIIRGNM